VLESYLLGYQHSAYAFHTNLNHIISLLVHLLKEKESNNKEVPATDTTPMEVDSSNNRELFTLNYHSLTLLHNIYAGVVKEPTVVEYASQEEVARMLDPVLNRFIELIYVLIERHTGHPELYQPVLELIQDYVCSFLPSETRLIHHQSLDLQYFRSSANSTRQRGLMLANCK